MEGNEYIGNTQVIEAQSAEETIVYPSEPKKRDFYANKSKTIILILSLSLVLLLAIIVFVIFIPKKKDVTSSVPESLSLYEESYSKMRNNEATYQETCNRFESVIESADEIGKFHYSVYYAKIIYDIEGDIEKAAGQIKKYGAIANTDSRLLDEYYAVLSDLYEEAGDAEQVEYYNQKLVELAPSEVIDVKENR